MDWIKRRLRLPRCTRRWGSWKEFRCKNQSVMDGLCQSCHAAQHGYQLTRVTREDIERALDTVLARLTLQSADEGG